jgi:hypothetical protein
MNSNMQSETENFKDQLEKERAAYQHNIERLKNQWVNERVEMTQQVGDVARDNAQMAETCKQWEDASTKQQKLYLAKVNQLKIKLKEQESEYLRAQ